jgi:glycylpeptide N-tetradecanoyltransferase
MIKYKKFLLAKLNKTFSDRKSEKLFRNFIIEKFSRPLPFDLSWNDIDGNNPIVIHELYNLLNNNYVEDCYSYLRFNYNHECIKFAISGPKWGSHFNLGIRFKRTKKIIGFISSNFRKIVTIPKILFCSEINFLCLEKKLRKKFFVQVLIKEISRRLNCLGIVSAVYTTGLPFLKPLLTTNYFYFFLGSSYKNNSRKIKNKDFFFENTEFNNKFYHLKCSDKKNISSIVKSDGIRIISRGKTIYKHFSFEDGLYWFRFIKGFKYTFIKREENSSDAKFIMSFYSLPCKTVKNNKSFYFYDSYFYYSVISKESKNFLKEVITICKEIGFDLFYILEGNFSERILKDLSFQKGENGINFYILGCDVEKIEPWKNGLIFF